MPKRSPRPAPRRADRSGNTNQAARAVLDGIRRLNRGLRLAARRVERETGLSGAQLFVLHHLAEAPATSINDLAARTHTDRSSVAAVVDRLEKAALVARTDSPNDARQQRVRITRRGTRKLSAAPPAPADLVLDGVAKIPRARALRLGKELDALNAVLGFQKAELLFADD